MMKQQPLKTDLIGDKTLKTDEKINFFGEVDELSAFIMEFTHYSENDTLNMQLIEIVKTLSQILADVAGSKNKIGENELHTLLDLCAYYGEKAGKFQRFVLPGKTLKGAKAHVLRTVTRRCERAYAKVYEKYGASEIIFEYLNKLSTLFYHIARIYDEKE
jgi:cob(I)alamin adenosyltransferase